MFIKIVSIENFQYWCVFDKIFSFELSMCINNYLFKMYSLHKSIKNCIEYSIFGLLLVCTLYCFSLFSSSLCLRHSCSPKCISKHTMYILGMHVFVCVCAPNVSREFCCSLVFIFNSVFTVWRDVGELRVGVALEMKMSNGWAYALVYYIIYGWSKVLQ